MPSFWLRLVVRTETYGFGTEEKCHQGAQPPYQWISLRPFVPPANNKDELRAAEPGIELRYIVFLLVLEA